jgi:hypothetical protein
MAQEARPHGATPLPCVLGCRAAAWNRFKVVIHSPLTIDTETLGLSITGLKKQVRNRNNVKISANRWELIFNHLALDSCFPVRHLCLSTSGT